MSTNRPLEHKRRRENKLDVRKKEILNVAIELSVTTGYQKITRELIAGHANTSEALITWYFTSMEDLKRDIIKAAISREILPILAQCLSLKDPRVKSLNKELKNKVIDFLTNH